MSEKAPETKDLKAEANRLRKDVASAQSAKSPIDLNSALKKIQSSSLPHEMKEELLAAVNKALTDLETAQAKSDIRVNNALSNQKEALKTAKFEQDKFDTEVKPIYDEFDKFHKGYLEKQTTHSDLLEKAQQEAASGKGISDQTKKALIDSEKALEKEKARLAQIKLTRLVATEQQVYHKGKISQIDKELSQTNSTPSSLSPSGLSRKELIEVKALHESFLTMADNKISEIKKHEAVQEKTKNTISKGLEEATKRGAVEEQKFWKDAAKAANVNLETPDKVVQKTATQPETIPKTKYNTVRAHSEGNLKTVKFSAKDIAQINKIQNLCNKQIANSNANPPPSSISQAKAMENKEEGKGSKRRGL